MVYMIVLNLGIWFLNCMNSKFYDNGMLVFFYVIDCGKGVELFLVVGGEIRIYFIVVDEVIWNYGLIGENNIDGVLLILLKRYINYYYFFKLFLFFE